MNFKEQISTMIAYQSIQEKIKWVWERNIYHSNLYTSAAEYLRRSKYLAEFISAICAFKCMDGRVHIPVITKTPLGIIQPFRSLGGRFDLGWPALLGAVKDWITKNINAGRNCIMLVTYHYSKGDKKRGCAGFNYDKEAAKASALELKKQIQRVCGVTSSNVCPVVLGIETDGDSLVFVNNDQEIDLYEYTKNIDVLTPEIKNQVKKDLRKCFHDMPEAIFHDIMPLAYGNLEHILEVRQNHQIIQIEHKEFILGVGSGFDWLHEPNNALIVGPWSPAFSNDLDKAFSIIKSNMDGKRISDDGFILLISSAWENSLDRQLGIEKINFLKKIALGILEEKYPDLAKKVHCMEGTIDASTKRLIELA